ncbi:MAG: protein kinase [Gemmatimonadales bacterium]
MAAQPPRCPGCQASLEAAADATVCPSCGRGLAHCINCREVLLREDRFCAACGSRQTVPPVAAGGSQPATLPAEGGPDVVERLRDATTGEYEIERELGRGGMAAVCLARDLALNRRVAIKVMSPELMLGAGMIERFRQEAQTVARLHHANIVTVHAIREQAGLYFLVMNYVEGRSLESLLRQEGQLPYAQVLQVLRQVGAALDYAHRNGVVHRDVKPGNILLDESGNAVVTDFGIAKVAAGAAVTNPGVPVGTPAYMSPEQCDGGAATAASDQYALGVVGYEMLTGRLPFEGTAMQVMRGHADRIPESIAMARPKCPAELREAVERMMSKAPAERFPTLAAATDAAAEAFDPPVSRTDELPAAPAAPAPAMPDPTPAPVGGPAPVIPVERHSAPRGSPPWGRLAGIGVAALVVVGILYVAFREPAVDESPPPAIPAARTRVSLSSGGDLAAALREVAPGGTIVLDSGAYQLAGPIRITAPVTIVGQGTRATRIAAAAGSGAFAVGPEVGTFVIRALELHYNAPGADPAIDIAGGVAEVSELRLQGTGVTDDDCRGMGAGIRVAGASRTAVSRSEIRGFCNGIQVVDSATATVNGNRIANNASGIRFQGTSRGDVEQNLIEDNAEGVTINAGSPMLDQNRLERNHLFGVFISSRGSPDLRNNKYSNNFQDVQREN